MEWDPYATEFKQQEDLAREAEEPFGSNDRNIYGILSSISGALDEDYIHNALTLKPGHLIAATMSSKRRPPVSKEELAHCWGIGINAATLTLKVTTQKGNRSALHPLK